MADGEPGFVSNLMRDSEAAPHRDDADGDGGQREPGPVSTVTRDKSAVPSRDSVDDLLSASTVFNSSMLTPVQPDGHEQEDVDLLISGFPASQCLLLPASHGRGPIAVVPGKFPK